MNEKISFMKTDYNQGNLGFKNKQQIPVLKYEYTAHGYRN